MPSNKDQRKMGRRALMEFEGMKVLVSPDGEDEVWTPTLGEAQGEPVRVTPGMPASQVYTAFHRSCANIANG